MNKKPLGHKSYGSIPHLPNSRTGPGDYHIEPGQARIATEQARDKHDVVIVQEKLDGANVSVAKINGEIVALSRAGYRAIYSPYQTHKDFNTWVENNKERFSDLLNEGERLCGEWLLHAVGTRYNLPHEPFVAFDIMQKQLRTPYSEFERRIDGLFVKPRLISIGAPLSVGIMLEHIETSGHGALDKVEGAIWRVERKGVVDFLTKYVRHDKEDGKYFPELNEGKITLNTYR